MKHSKSLLVGLAFCIGALVGALFVQAQTSLSIQYLMGGVYPGAPTYTFFIESSNYLAKDANGQIDYSGTNCTDVIIDALTACSGKGDFLFSDGVFLIDGCILYTSANASFRGMGENTVLRVKSTSAAIGIFDMITPDYLKISDMLLDGNKENVAYDSTEKAPIRIRNGGGNITVENVRIIDSVRHGIVMTTATGYAQEWLFTSLTINNVQIENAGKTGQTGVNGFYMDGGIKNLQMANVRAFHCQNDGIKIKATTAAGTRLNYSCQVTNAISEYNGGNGVMIQFIEGASLTNVRARNNTLAGINIQYSDYVSLINPYCEYNGCAGVNVVGDLTYGNCTFINVQSGSVISNSQNPVTTYSGIWIYGTEYSTFMNVKCLDNQDTPTQKYGIREVAESDYNILIGIIANGNDTNGILTTGANTKTHLCYNEGVWIA